MISKCSFPIPDFGHNWCLLHADATPAGRAPESFSVELWTKLVFERLLVRPVRTRLPWGRLVDVDDISNPSSMTHTIWSRLLFCGTLVIMLTSYYVTGCLRCAIWNTTFASLHNTSDLYISLDNREYEFCMYEPRSRYAYSVPHLLYCIYMIRRCKSWIPVPALAWFTPATGPMLDISDGSVQHWIHRQIKSLFTLRRFLAWLCNHLKTLKQGSFAWSSIHMVVQTWGGRIWNPCLKLLYCTAKTNSAHLHLHF